MTQVKCAYCESLFDTDRSVFEKHFCDELCADAYIEDRFDITSAVREFQRKFNIPMAPLDRAPQQLPADLVKFRVAFIQEELDEYERACEANDLPKQLDALCDMMYVVVGTALMQGFDARFHLALARVHQANMKKVAGVSTKRHEQYDITKPEGWTPPMMEDLCESR